MKINPKHVIADHIRASCFIISEGIKPGPKERGYVLRRLIRRSLAASVKLGIEITNKDYYAELVDSVIEIYEGAYNQISISRELIIETLFKEAQKYQKAIKVGEKEWQKYISKQQPKPLESSAKIWDLYQTHGVPIELSEDILEKQKVEYSKSELLRLIGEHQELSKTTAKGQFTSGLGEQSEKTKKLHTTTHILHDTLRKMLGDKVRQMGSAITNEKARFDFTFERKMTADELKELEDTVQSIIDKDLDMIVIETTPEKAKEMGAIGLFGEKYGDKVTVYSLTDKDGSVYSREFCTGPHVTKTSQIGKFKILKHKSIGAGLKRLEFYID